MAEAVETLANAERRSELEVLRAIASANYDVQYLRSHPDGLPSGFAVIGDAVGALQGAQTMVTAAALSLDDAVLVHSRRPTTKTRTLLSETLAGPTSEGSYVISVHVPIPPVLTPEDDLVLFELGPGSPWERRVTSRLCESVVLAQSLAATSVSRDEIDLEVWAAHPHEGISANLLEGIAASAGITRESSRLDFSFTWALDHPMELPVDTITFSQAELRVVSEVATRFRERTPEPDVRLIGHVVRLHRESGHLGPGEVTVAGYLEGDDRTRLMKVSVSLSESEYEVAISAHRGGEQVAVDGDLEMRGTKRVLRNSRSFGRAQ